MFLVTTPSKNGSADVDDLLVKRRGLAQGSAFWGFRVSRRFEKLSRGSFPQNRSKFGLEKRFLA
jgi:hypothetical protein